MKNTAVMLCVVAVLAVSLGGCGTWINERYPDRNFQTDYNQCWADAAASYPVQSVYLYDRTDCTTTYNAKRREKTTICETYPVYGDNNAQSRHNMAENCIVFNGWTFDLFNFKNGVYFVPLWLAFSTAFQ